MVSSVTSSPSTRGSWPSSLAASAAFSQASAHTDARSSPVITASASSGAAESRAVRTAPTRTNVPVLSLKSSAIRPRNTRPAPGSSGSARPTASPVR